MNGLRAVSAVLVAGLSLLAWDVSAIAQSSPYFWWKVEPERAANGPNGLTWDMFSAQTHFDLEFTFKNEETDGGVLVPPGFFAAIELSLLTGKNRVPVTITWKRVQNLPTADPVDVPLNKSFVVPADRLFKALAEVRPANSTSFEAVTYVVALNMERAVSQLNFSNDMTPWRGRYVTEGEIVIHCVPPNTATDVKRHRFLEGGLALDRNDPDDAIKHYSEILRLDFADPGAHYGIGEAYRELGRFREAAREFEYVAASVPEKSLIYADLAYVYVALGDVRKAESFLRHTVPRERIPAFIERIKEDLKARREQP